MQYQRKKESEGEKNMDLYCFSWKKIEIENASGNCGARKYIEESFIMASVWHHVYCIVLLMGYT